MHDVPCSPLHFPAWIYSKMLDKRGTRQCTDRLRATCRLSLFETIICWDDIIVIDACQVVVR